VTTIEASAAAVLATLVNARPRELRTLAAGLALAGGTVGLFANAIDCYADVLERGEESGTLATLAMRVGLKLAALDGEFVKRLEDAGEPFWRAVYEALEEMRQGLT